MSEAMRLILTAAVVQRPSASPADAALIDWVRAGNYITDGAESIAPLTRQAVDAEWRPFLRAVRRGDRPVIYPLARLMSRPQPRQKRSASLNSMPQAGHLSGAAASISTPEATAGVAGLGAIAAVTAVAPSGDVWAKLGGRPADEAARPQPMQKESPARRAAPQKAQLSATPEAAGTMGVAAAEAPTGPPQVMQKASPGTSAAPQWAHVEPVAAPVWKARPPAPAG